MKTNNPLSANAQWNDHELVVTGAILEAQAARSYASVSTLHAFDKCPARMIADRSLGSTFDLLGAREIGNAAHTVLERLFQLPPADRTERSAMELLTVLASDDPQPGTVDYRTHLGDDLVLRTTWSARVAAAVTGIFSIEDPTQVDVVATEFELDPDTAEFAGIPLKGFVDRVDRYKGSLRVVDYKTGKAKKPYRGLDDEGDQVRTYADSVASVLGERVARGALFYTRVGQTRQVTVADKARRQVGDRYAGIWAQMTRAAETGRYETRPSPLCGWCPLVNACSSATRGDATGTAAQASELAIPGSAPAAPRAPGSHMKKVSTHERGTLVNIERWREAKAWEGLVVDGHPNMASWGATAISGLMSMAADRLTIDRPEVTEPEVRALTHTLGLVVSKAMRRVVGHDDLDSGAHTRFRGLLHSILPGVDLPFGGTDDQWRHTLNALVDALVARAGVLTTTMQDGYAAEPWAAFVPSAHDAASVAA